MNLFYLIFILFLISCQKPVVTILECGGGGEFSCPAGTFCEMNDECGGVDAKGICVPVPEDCSQKEEVVCGCNGRTYSNTCLANAAKVTVDYRGPCINKEQKTNDDTNKKKFDFPDTKHEIDPSAVENAGDREDQEFENSIF